MTKFQILNTASELRRAANWLYRDQKEKFPLIKNIIKEAQSNPKIKNVLENFKVNRYLDKPSILAEQLLASSVRLKNLATHSF